MSEFDMIYTYSFQLRLFLSWYVMISKVTFSQSVVLDKT